MTSLLLAASLLLLLLPLAAPWPDKQPSCRASCFILANKTLHCALQTEKGLKTATPIVCLATRLRDRTRLVIGHYESVHSIAPKGLSVFATAFKDELFILRLDVKLKSLDPDSIFTALPKLHTLSLLEPPKDPCIFANVTAPFLSLLRFQCLGLHRQPFELVLPPSKPQLRLNNCALSLECRSCGSKTVAVATPKHLIRLSQRMPTHTCPPVPERTCPACARFTTTVIPSPTTTTMPLITSEAPNVTIPPTAVDVAVVKSRSNRAQNSAVTRKAALIAALERRLLRTQNLLIVILCLTLANSFVLIGLCGYFARRRRWCFCGKKDIYVVAKTVAA